MTIQTIPLSALEPSKTNPRKTFDAAAIEGLAASIKADGLLQNVVAVPIKGKGERYRITSGERRYRALRLLAKRGDITEDFPVPVQVRTGLGKDDTRRIATVENLQRQNLTPLEETDALTNLIHGKVTPDDIAAQTGLSLSTIKRRLALNSLCAECRAALAEGVITLGQAEAMTLGDHGRQRQVLEQIESGYYTPDAGDIRQHMLDEKPTVAMAIFDMDQYTGTLTTDLFAEAETTYVDDVEQFMALQRAAVEALVARHGETTPWVELTAHYQLQHWHYREPEDGDEVGVVINLSPSGRVEVLENVARRPLPAHTMDTLRDVAAPEAKTPRAAYPLPLRRSIAHHKTIAVQEVLSGNLRKAMEVSVTLHLATLTPHEAFWSFSEDAAPPMGYVPLEQALQTFADELGVPRIPVDAPSRTGLYEAVKTLTDDRLNDLHALLTALAFGQEACEHLDTGDSLFNRVACDLEIAMRDHWQPDERFFRQRTKAQLAEIAVAIGYATTASALTGIKKEELVTVLARHVRHAQDAEAPTEAQQKARDWLPDAMRFPAVDQSAEAQETVDVLAAVA